MATLKIKPGVLNIVASQGKTWRITVSMPEDFSFAGYSARFQMRTSAGAASTILDLSSAPGLTLSGNTLVLLVPATTTAGIAPGSYVHEIELTEPDGGKPPFLAGAVTVEPEVVR